MSSCVENLLAVGIRACFFRERLAGLRPSLVATRLILEHVSRIAEGVTKSELILLGTAQL